HRALEVSEEDGHLLALALEGLTRGEDPLGKMPRRVGVGRGRVRHGGHPTNDRSSTFVAKLRVSGEGSPARATRQAHSRHTAKAEVRRWWIFVLAAETLHAVASRLVSRPGGSTVAPGGTGVKDEGSAYCGPLTTRVQGRQTWSIQEASRHRTLEGNIR